MNKQLLVGSLAVLAIAGSLYFSLHKPKEKEEQVATDASEALGQRAALEVAQMLGEKGQIAVIGLETKPGQAPTYVAEKEIFTKTLKKHGVTIGQSKDISGGTTGLVMGGGLSVPDYSGLLEKSSGAGAVVSLVGLPHTTAEEIQKLQAGHPPLVVVDLFGTTTKGPLLDELLDQKVVALALIPRTLAEVEAAKDEPKTFERYYKILRPTGAH